MRSINKYTGRIIISGLALCMTMTAAFANTLSEIEVYQNGTGYGVSLKTDNTAQMKKIVSSTDRMSVILKDVKVSENLNTVYNNVSRMDNITVQPAGKNDIKINFKGKGISNSTVSFASSSNVAAYPETKSIQLNAPVSSYTPVYNPENFAVREEVSQTANPQLNEILTQMHISREMLLTVKRYAKAAVTKSKLLVKSVFSGDMNMLTMLGVAIIAVALILRPRKNSGKQQRKNSIGLSRINSNMRANANVDANIEREIGINKNLVNNMNLQSTVKGNYGVKAYQQSQRNPYMTGMNNQSNGISGISRRRDVSSHKAEPKQTLLTKNSAPLPNDILANRTKQASNTSVLPKLPKISDEFMAKTEKMAKTAPSISKPVSMKPSLKQSTANNQQAEIDSMKFLESITKIYENSGRTDLAKGLKDNLRKAQLTKAV